MAVFKDAIRNNLIMNRQLTNILIIIAVLVGLYYWISPYQNCMRESIARDGEYAENDPDVILRCSNFTKW